MLFNLDECMTVTGDVLHIDGTILVFRKKNISNIEMKGVERIPYQK